MLAPEGYGEIIGGSQRIHDYDLLVKRLKEHNLPKESSSGISTSAATAASPTPASAWAWSAPSPGFAAPSTSARSSPSRACSTAFILSRYQITALAVRFSLGLTGSPLLLIFA